MPKIILPLFLFVTVNFAIAQTNEQNQVKPYMQTFYSLVERVQGFVYEKAEYFNKKNEKEIAAVLKQFNETLKNFKKEKISHNDDMKFRLAQMSEGLTEAELTFKEGSKDYSYWMLKSSLVNCYSCHTQKSLGGTHYQPKSSKKQTSFSRAEFLYMVRNYEDSLPLFEKIVTGYPKNGASTEELESALQRLLYYAVRVSKDDAETLRLFERLLKNSELLPTVKNDILAWRKYLTVKKYGLSEAPTLDSGAALKQYVEERDHLAGSYRLSSQRYIIDLETTQKLYDLLASSQDASIKPWILYWIAYQEKDYRFTMFDLSVENYLKECIERYSTHPAAKKCFTFYKEMQRDSFTGSSGTNIPASVQRQIDAYENLINKK